MSGRRAGRLNNMPGNKIAILGSTSHIAKGLITNFSKNPEVALFLFARSTDELSRFLRLMKLPKEDINCLRFEDFLNGRYDVVINCVGKRTPSSMKKGEDNIFRLTEQFDDLCIDYLQKHKGALYINFSSGAVYGTEFPSPAGVGSKNQINVNELGESHYYSIAKLNSEAKHRSYENLRITDLRVFAYFSRFIDLKTKYLITEIINSIANKSVFKTGENNIIRDYVGDEDLFSLVCKCIENGSSGAYDVYSRAPVEKFEILNSFHEKFGLRYKISETINSPLSISGPKWMYYSTNKKSKKLGYAPKYGSLELLIKETEIILRKKLNKNAKQRKIDFD